MKNKKTTEKTIKHEYIESITCDICKKVYEGDDWERNDLECLETEVRMKTGYNFPEGGCGEEINYDICPLCFEDKLIPALKTMGAESTVENWQS